MYPKCLFWESEHPQIHHFPDFRSTLDGCNFAHTCWGSKMFGVQQSPWSNSLISGVFWWKWLTCLTPGCQIWSEIIMKFCKFCDLRFSEISATLSPTEGEDRWIIFTKTLRKSTNWIKGFIGHQKFLVSDKYEKSYSSLKSTENPDFWRSETQIVCEIQDFHENLSKKYPKILKKIKNIIFRNEPIRIRAFRSIFKR